MATRQFTLTKEQTQELFNAYDRCKDGPTRTRYQAVRLYGTDYEEKKVETITGYSRSSLMSWCQIYRERGIVANQFATCWPFSQSSSRRANCEPSSIDVTRCIKPPRRTGMSKLGTKEEISSSLSLPNSIPSLGLVFPTAGCWEVTAKAANSQLSFGISIGPQSTSVTVAQPGTRCFLAGKN